MDADEWRQRVGIKIERARTAKRYSKRRAANEAGFDEALWRQLEVGYRLVQGNQIAANPKDENLEAAARVVGLDPAELFEAAGRTYDQEEMEISASGVDLAEYERLDPDGYADLMRQAREGLDRARARRLS